MGVANSQELIQLHDPLLIAIRDYWNGHIHDLEIATEPIGSLGFFDQLDEYRFDKLRYLPHIVDFDGLRDKRLLEIGCGVGTDLARFAKGGAEVTGVDLAEVSISLAKDNFSLRGLNADLKVMKVELEHEDAPILKKYSINEYKQLLSPFEKVTIIPERFPVQTKLHHGIKAALYNKGFVKGFNLLPRALVRPLGWHLMAFASNE